MSVQCKLLFELHLCISVLHDIYGSDSEAAMATYPYLRPSVGMLPGTTQKFLKLDGTVQMFYQGNGYFVPLCIYLRDDHPTSPPVCIITPTAEMMIKPNHRHVDAQGVVYLPYLHEWNRKSNLVEMVQAVGAVFTADPFIFKKPRPAPGPPPYASTGPPVDLASKTPVYAHKATVAAAPPRHPPPPPPAPRDSAKPATKDQFLAKTKLIEDLDSVLENSFRCPISMEIMQVCGSSELCD